MNKYLQSRSISMLAWRIWLNAALPLGLGMLGNPEVITQGLGTRHKSKAAHSCKGIPEKNAKVKSLTFVTKDKLNSGTSLVNLQLPKSVVVTH